MYTNAIFDVDGTIIDSFEGISNCLKYAFEKMGKTSPPLDFFRKFVGPSLFDSFKQYSDFSESEIKEVINFYREKYNVISVEQTCLYDGYPRIFERLKAKGVRLSVASAKPTGFIIKIFDKFNIGHYFEKIIGAEEVSTTSDKSELIKRAILTDKPIMIGDRKFDIIAAKKVGIDCIGVTYGGFCEENEFINYKPDFIADNTDDIFNIIINTAKLEKSF